MNSFSRLKLLLVFPFISTGFAFEKLNVLFIAVDDLRPELNCYGNDKVHSPNIDALAARGTLFERAYCQVAVCGASRASLMTGLRPETTRCWNFKTPMREKNPDALSMPQ
ncbi:sulfatase-like hydrolase/transferase, partial [Akkermansiaceae bacterium]|nr:sulfatase-like hydrolase/transferase [Akkermansiaceae bacterium]